MSVVTLTLKYGFYPSVKPRPEKLQGWGVKIVGLKPEARKDLMVSWTDLNPVQEEKVDGNVRLLVTPCERQEFHNAMYDDVPMEYITLLLNLLSDLGFKVVGTQAFVHSSPWATLIWTLQK